MGFSQCHSSLSLPATFGRIRRIAYSGFFVSCVYISFYMKKKNFVLWVLNFSHCEFWCIFSAYMCGISGKIVMFSQRSVLFINTYTETRPFVLALDLEGVHDVKLHHPSSSVATSNQ